MTGRRAVLAVGVAVAGLFVYRVAPATDTNERTIVERGDLVFAIDVEGALQAVDTNPLGPPAVRGVWDYKISFLAPEGKEVSQGEPVVSFDASELMKHLEERRAERDSSAKELEKKKSAMIKRQRDDLLRLAEARARLEKTRLKLERPGELVAARETRALELDRELAEKEVRYLHERGDSLDRADRTEIEMIEDQNRRASARVRELEEAIDRMTLRAPRDGTVVHVVDRRGEKKRVGDSVWRQEKVVAIPDLSEMRAIGYVDEADAGVVAAGQRVELRLDAYPEMQFSGRVRKVARTVQPRSRNSPVRVVRVSIELDQTDVSRMRPEMRFRGEIEVETVSDVLLVPVEAVRQTTTGPAVLVDSWAGARPRSVDLGRANDRDVEVLRGLSAGDRILLGTADQGLP